MWVALLNLENKYADDVDTATSELLQRALQHNDAKKMYLAALDIFKRSNRTSLLQTCAKGTAYVRAHQNVICFGSLFRGINMFWSAVEVNARHA